MGKKVFFREGAEMGGKWERILEGRFRRDKELAMVLSDRVAK